MAVNDVTTNSQTPATNAGGRRLKVGANVAITIVLVLAVVGVLQAIAYSIPGAKHDMTSSGINSLSDGTTNLLRDLDEDVTLTSLYFETDLEDEDQPHYRRAVDDLLALYESTQRAKVRREWINPLSDHDKLKELTTRLRSKELFAKELEPYKKAVDLYTSELDGQMRAAVQAELDAIGAMTGPMSEQSTRAIVGQVETLLTRWSEELQTSREQIDNLVQQGNPQYSAAINILKTVYRDFSKTLKDIAQFGKAQAQKNAELKPEASQYLTGAGGRFAELVGKLEGQNTALGELEPLKVDELLRKLSPNSNAVIVETEKDAMIVDFPSVWPPVNENRSGPARFKDRGFKGEEKITSAILRVTHKEQTAVVFVRYGGMPFFMGAMMPGQQSGAPFTTMKRQLEDANFIVEEWDLKAKDTPPELDPKPTRTVYIVFKPTEPERGPMGQPPQEPPFTESHRKAVLNALGENGRALFVAGWYPGPFGAMPGTYDWAGYLKDTWGITVDNSTLLIETMSFAPGKYGVGRRDFYNMDKVDVKTHPITSGAQARVVALPWCAPLQLAEPAPEGVSHEILAVQPQRDGIWGIKDIQKYQSQIDAQGHLSRLEGDLEGPFTLAVAATKGDSKLVVVSSREFAVDAVAFAQEMGLTGEGFTIRSRNPGNVSLLINSLHWLNDNTAFMNVGQPIDAAVLEVRDRSTVKAIQALTIFVWPALALACGGIAWWTRRR